MLHWYWLLGLEHVVVRNQRAFISDQDWLEYSIVKFLVIGFYQFQSSSCFYKGGTK